MCPLLSVRVLRQHGCNQVLDSTGGCNTLRSCVSRRSVADEIPVEDLLHGAAKGPDVGTLAKG
jgi:hypothetical protein